MYKVYNETYLDKNKPFHIGRRENL